ncbi:MAG: NAD(P)H-dependent oxidoreductase [Pseudomonadales bacterium]|nr:NAD(P)H-dependent oxidoreductase [Pseudomonadales bacterium]
MKLLLLSGSFHSTSKSRAILNSVKDFFPEYEYVFPQLDLLPFYSQDLVENKPSSVLELIESVHAVDGIIVCSPEYNHSVPAVLKNAIDWASRPAFKSALKGKPVTVITQANSPVGGARAQAHIKLIFDSTLSSIHPAHEMMISDIDNVVDINHQITDIQIKKRLKRHILSFIDFIKS